MNRRIAASAALLLSALILTGCCSTEPQPEPTPSVTVEPTDEPTAEPTAPVEPSTNPTGGQGEDGSR